jgi:hypothetical protein
MADDITRVIQRGKINVTEGEAPETVASPTAIFDPGVIDGETWNVTKGEGAIGRDVSEAMVPLDTLATSENIRRHELGHMLFSPEESVQTVVKRLGVDVMSLRAVEEARVNTLLKNNRMSVGVTLNKKYSDGMNVYINNGAGRHRRETAQQWRREKEGMEVGTPEYLAKRREFFDDNNLMEKIGRDAAVALASLYSTGSYGAIKRMVKKWYSPRAIETLENELKEFLPTGKSDPGFEALEKLARSFAIRYPHVEDEQTAPNLEDEEWGNEGDESGQSGEGTPQPPGLQPNRNTQPQESQHNSREEEGQQSSKGEGEKENPLGGGGRSNPSDKEEKGENELQGRGGKESEESSTEEAGGENEVSNSAGGEGDGNAPEAEGDIPIGECSGTFRPLESSESGNLKCEYPDEADGWGELKRWDAPLSTRAPGRFGKQVKNSDYGTTVRRAYRLFIDGLGFRRRMKGKRASILIDVSGSHLVDPIVIEKLLSVAPRSDIALYSGNGQEGQLVVVAKNGKLIDAKEFRILLNRMGGMNTVDGPALRWLARKPSPRLWVSDGHVNGKWGVLTDAMRAEVNRTCRSRCIRRVDMLKLQKMLK